MGKKSLPISDKERAKAARTTIRDQASQLVGDFEQQFGDITCIGLIHIDFSKGGAYRRFLKAGVVKEKCEHYVKYIITQLYRFEGIEKIDQAAFRRKT